MSQDFHEPSKWPDVRLIEIEKQRSRMLAIREIVKMVYTAKTLDEVKGNLINIMEAELEKKTY